MENTLEFPSIVTSRRVVPNQKPLSPPGALRIAIVGEAPSEDEENYMCPFVGRSGQFLTRTLQDVGIDRNRCLIANVCQVRPPGNRITAFPWDGEEIQQGIKKLHEDICEYNPNIIVCVGATPLHAARATDNVTAWRGSLFLGTVPGSPMFGRKCIATFHPSYVLREFSAYPLLKFDLKRAREEGESPDLVLPQRELITNLSGDALCYLMDNWPTGQRCALDIEGGLKGWPCVSICARPSRAITIAWGRLSESEHARTLRSFARLMARTDVPKVLQNSLYDNFVLSYGYGIPIRNVVEDTMIKSWEIYAELPRSLGVQTSIWTREPFYKSERKSEDSETFFRYCAKDSAVTLEICERQDSFMTGSTGTHYRKMIEMLNPFHYMEQRGIRYDQTNVKAMLDTTSKQIGEVADRIGLAAGRELRGAKGSLSAKRLAACLYTEKGYPPQYKKEQGRRTEKLTTDVEALLTLKRPRPDDQFLSDILLHRHLEGIRETLQITADADGRVRCGYSLEAETGRVKCYTSPTGSGANLQTIQKSLRGNYTADPGHDFFQCDLEGADGWTVAAHSARLGDNNMLDDYASGMKPAKIIALLYWFGTDINKLDRESLKHAHNKVFPIVLKEAGKWLYMGCKRVQHGSSYLMGIPTMQLNVLRDSFKESGTPIYMEHRDAVTLQSGCFFARYPGVRSWHNWGQSKLVADGKLTAASGHTRLFFGRRYGADIKDTVKQFLAHEPQNNTTWATNMAMLNLWNDPENRRPDGSLIIEPLHQVHDALCGQWPQSVRDWARAKVKGYFNNQLTIAGHTLVIPFDGTWGSSWGDMPHKL